MEIQKVKLSNGDMKTVNDLNKGFYKNKIINPKYLENRERGIAKLKITGYVNQSIFRSRHNPDGTFNRNRVIAEFAGCSIRGVRKVFAQLQIKQFLKGVSVIRKHKRNLYVRKLIGLGLTEATQKRFVKLLLDTQGPKYKGSDTKDNPNLPDPVETENFYAIEL